MRAVVQRVTRGSVQVDGKSIAAIGRGYVILLGVGPADPDATAAASASKISLLRVFEDEQGKMNRSIQDIGGQALVVSQFTLYADTRRGNRPSFIKAAAPEIASPLVQGFAAHLPRFGIPVEQGGFGARMLAEIE